MTTLAEGGLHTNCFGNPTMKSHEYDAETHKGTITFSGDVATLNQGAFYKCDGLTSVTLPESLKTIGVMAFKGCTSLTSVTIPKNVTTIEYLAFNETGMECPAVAEGNTTYKVDGNCLIRIADNTVIEGFKTSEIPSYIKSIGKYAFNNIGGLTNITIPVGVTSIGESAFSSNAGLTSITIPEGVASIGDGAFYVCESLTSVTVMATTPATFGNDVFKYCAADLQIIVPTENRETYKTADGWSAYADKMKWAIAEVTVGGVATKYIDVVSLKSAVNNTTSGEMSIKLLADCNLKSGFSEDKSLSFYTSTTFDLNGHMLNGWLNIMAPTTINDSSEGKTGLIRDNSLDNVISTSADLTINGGTFECYSIIEVNGGTVTLKGGSFNISDTYSAFIFNNTDAKVVIPDGYEYTDGNGNSVTGTLTKASDKVTFAGSVVKTESATAVDNIDAQKAQKTVKTVENGQIVIIRNGEKFNLRGAKIK